MVSTWIFNFGSIWRCWVGSRCFRAPGSQNWTWSSLRWFKIKFSCFRSWILSIRTFCRALFWEISSFRLGWSKMQKGQKSPLPGHFPIHFDILVWKMQKNLKKIVVLPLLKSNLCLLLPLNSNQLTNTLLWPKSPSKCCPMNF